MPRLPHHRDTTAPAPPQDRTSHPARTALWLLGGAIVIWGIMCLLGLLLTHVLEHTGFHHADLGTNRWFVGHRVPFLNDVAGIGTGMAETVTVVVIAAVLVGVLRWRTGRWYEAMVLVVSVVGEVAIFICVTLIVPQRRPPVHRLDAAPPTSSYPSGHTGASIALYCCLALIILWLYSDRGWARAVAVLLFCVPAYVGLSRIYMGMHYPSDVVAGALLSSLWLSLVATTLLPRRSAAQRARGQSRRRVLGHS
ncbi:MAG TPA: phosphatase PAP2 family protein [Streptosporangiaceae bacterium]